MPEVSQYNFGLQELAEILLREAGVKEGKWSLGVTFGVNIGNIGSSQADAKPTIMAVVDGLTLAKVEDNIEAVGLVIDAAKSVMSKS